MIGMELVRDPASKTPDKVLTANLQTAALQRGVILLSAGTYGNVVRVLAPLNTPAEILEEGLDAVEDALEAVAASRS
jgi:4-aminobutyrate aminotransferase/(S)-3-amino-2-methylpropionate transaminase